MSVSVSLTTMSESPAEFPTSEHRALTAYSYTPLRIPGGPTSAYNTNTSEQDVDGDCVVRGFDHDHDHDRSSTISPQPTSVASDTDNGSRRSSIISPRTPVSSLVVREGRGTPSRSEARLCRVPHRQRTAQACERCRRRKTKCCGTQPTCQPCKSRGLVCEYAAEPRRRSRSRSKNSCSVSPKSSSPGSRLQGWSPHSGDSVEVDIELPPFTTHSSAASPPSHISSSASGSPGVDWTQAANRGLIMSRNGPHESSMETLHPNLNDPVTISASFENGTGYSSHFNPQASFDCVPDSGSTFSTYSSASDGFHPSEDLLEWLRSDPPGLRSLPLSSSSSFQTSASSTSSSGSMSPFHAGVEGLPLDTFHCATQTLSSLIANTTYPSLASPYAGVERMPLAMSNHWTRTPTSTPEDQAYSSSSSDLWSPFYAGVEGMPFDMSLNSGDCHQVLFDTSFWGAQHQGQLDISALHSEVQHQISYAHPCAIPANRGNEYTHIGIVPGLPDNIPKNTNTMIPLTPRVRDDIRGTTTLESNLFYDLHFASLFSAQRTLGLDGAGDCNFPLSCM